MGSWFVDGREERLVLGGKDDDTFQTKNSEAWEMSDELEHSRGRCRAILGPPPPVGFYYCQFAYMPSEIRVGLEEMRQNPRTF